jgi:hypothetical protein
MAAVARTGPHRRVKNDELIAHYARAGDGWPAVIRKRQLVDRGGLVMPRSCILVS